MEALQHRLALASPAAQTRGMFYWMARHSAIGGIYGRPIVVGNLLHFASAAIAFAKVLMRAPEARMLWPLGVLYAVLALGFAVVLFRSPVREGSTPVAPRS